MSLVAQCDRCGRLIDFKDQTEVESRTVDFDLCEPCFRYLNREVSENNEDYEYEFSSQE